MVDKAARPDLLAIHERYRSELRSRGADIGVSFHRTAWLGGTASLRRDAMARLKERLKPAGVGAEHVLTDRIRAESQGWVVVTIAFVVAAAFFFRGERATAAVVAGVPLVLRLLGTLEWPRLFTSSLRVRCDDDEGTRKVLDILQGAKDFDVDNVDWRFDREPPKADWVEECIRRANARAARAAEALGVRVLGVHRYEESWDLPGERRGRDATHPIDLSTRRARRGGADLAEVDDDAPPSTSSGAFVGVRVLYHIGEYRPPAPS